MRSNLAEMRSADLAEFSNLFLSLDGGQPVVRTQGQHDHERVKRPHTKSRHGCVGCKKRRVKCDENLPCQNCVKRKEKCQRPDPRPAKVELPQQPTGPCQHVNTLHIELFYHFEKVTVHTLAFPEIWDLMLQVSFHNEFLMHAILSVAAKHISTLRPQDARYAEAAIVLLNHSIQSFRETLSTPITNENCDARLGTSLLINYMTWTDIGFIEGQSILDNPDAGGLDLSGDLLFCIGSGIRQVFFTAFPLFRDHSSPFVTAAQYHPCHNLETEADRRGTRWREIMIKFLRLWNDPRYNGSSPPLTDHSPADSSDTNSDGATAWTPSFSESFDEPVCSEEQYVYRVIERTNDPASIVKFAVEGATARDIYERMVQRISVVLSLIPPEGSFGAGEDITDEFAPLSEERLQDVERYFFSFPTLCFDPFLPLVLNGDSRVLVVLYHTYRAATCLLNFERTWWAAERAVTMEKLIFAELRARGLSVDVYT